MTATPCGHEHCLIVELRVSMSGSDHKVFLRAHVDDGEVSQAAYSMGKEFDKTIPHANLPYVEVFLFTLWPDGRETAERVKAYDSIARSAADLGTRVENLLRWENKMSELPEEIVAKMQAAIEQVKNDPAAMKRIDEQLDDVMIQMLRDGNAVMVTDDGRIVEVRP